MVGICLRWWWWESVSDKIPPLTMMMMIIAKNACEVALFAYKGLFSKMLPHVYLEITSSVTWIVALITEELLPPWMCWYMSFKVSALFERRFTLVATEWFFYLNVWACVIWDNQLRRMNSCTDHRWNASPLNAVLTCVVWGDSFVWRMTYTECNLMLFSTEWVRTCLLR